MQIYFGRPISLSLPLKHARLTLMFTAILLIQWVFWLVSAMADAFDDYAGGEYQGIIGIIISTCLTLVVLVPSALLHNQVVMLGGSVIVGTSIYLTFGVFYFLHERHWNMGG